MEITRYKWFSRSLAISKLRAAAKRILAKFIAREIKPLARYKYIETRLNQTGQAGKINSLASGKLAASPTARISER
jgi:hypothetical protein